MRRMTGTMVAVLAVACLAGPAAAEEYVYAGQWGSQGTGPGQFTVIGGIASAGGRVYVTDMVPLLIERVQVFDANGALLDEGTDWDDKKGVAGGLDVDGLGNIHTSVVDVFTKIGPTFVPLLRRELADFNPAPDAFRPTDVALSPSGDMYIAEMGQHRIVRLNLAGDYVTALGSYGGGDGQLNFVGGVAVAPDGSVYASDHLGNRVLKFDAAGQFVAAWGEPGIEPGQFTNPRGIDVDDAGDVYVADWIGQRVQKFDAAGGFICAFGERGAGDGQFDGPVDVAVTGDGSAVYIADLLNCRVQRFDRQP